MLGQLVGSGGGKDDDDVDAPQEERPGARDSPDRVLVCVWVGGRKQVSLPPFLYFPPLPFSSGSPEPLLHLRLFRSIKKWKCPEGTFVHNFSGHDAIINTLSVNEDGVMFSGGALPFLNDPGFFGLEKSTRLTG